MMRCATLVEDIRNYFLSYIIKIVAFIFQVSYYCGQLYALRLLMNSEVNL